MKNGNNFNKGEMIPRKILIEPMREFGNKENDLRYGSIFIFKL
jgi:hypothetical protein